MSVRIAILRCGGIARHHVRLFKANARIVAMCDVCADIVNNLTDVELADLAQRPQAFADPSTT